MKLSELFLPQEEWITIKIGKKTCKLLVRSREDDEYRVAVDRIIRMCRDDETLDILALTREAVAKYLLIDWTLTDDDGNPLKYDPDQAITLFKLNSKIFTQVCKKAEEIHIRNTAEADDTEKK